MLFSSTILSGFLPPLTNWAWPRAWLRPVNRSTQNSSRGFVRERYSALKRKDIPAPATM